MYMAKFKNNKKQTRVDRNISTNKDFYNTPIIIKDNIDSKRGKIFVKILNSKYINMIFLIIASLLVGGLLFYFINYNNFNEDIKIKHVSVDKNYLFLGDSLTYRYNLDKFYPDKKNIIVNSGINGNKTNNILDNMYNRVYKYNPSDVFILIGTNDISKGYSLQKIFDNYISIITQIKKNRPAATIRIISIYPVNYDLRKIDKKVNKLDSINRLNESLKIYCKNNSLVYIDMYSKLVDDKGYLDKKYTEDGLHLNDEGYEVVTSVLMKYMEE